MKKKIMFVSLIAVASIIGMGTNGATRMGKVHAEEVESSSWVVAAGSPTFYDTDTGYKCVGSGWGVTGNLKNKIKLDGLEFDLLGENITDSSGIGFYFGDTSGSAVAGGGLLLVYSYRHYVERFI
jgi:hypothetical protein